MKVLEGWHLADPLEIELDALFLQLLERIYLFCYNISVQTLTWLYYYILHVLSFRLPLFVQHCQFHNRKSSFFSPPTSTYIPSQLKEYISCVLTIKEKAGLLNVIPPKSRSRQIAGMKKLKAPESATSKSNILWIYRIPLIDEVINSPLSLTATVL